MPIYDYKCLNCGDESLDVWAKMYEETIPCKCGGVMERLISRAYINPDIEPFWEENMGHEPVYIKSRQHREEMMQKHGLVDDYGVGTKKTRWV